MMPLKVYRKEADGYRYEAADHPAYGLVHSRPSYRFTPTYWKKHMMVHTLIHGFSITRVIRDGMGTPTSLRLYHPSCLRRVTMNVEGILYYELYDDLKHDTAAYSGRDIIHIQCMEDGGLIGKSIIGYAREDLGVSIAMRDYSADTYKNGGRPKSILEKEGTLKEDARKRIAQSWNANYGYGGQGGVAILEDGLKFKQMAFPPGDLEFMKSRDFSDEEIARWFNYPPYLLHKKDTGGSYNSLEMNNQGYLTYTLQPWISKIEEELTFKLFAVAGEDDLYAEFDMDVLLRADTKSRAELERTHIQNGLANPNEIRNKYNRNPYKEGNWYMHNGGSIPVHLMEAFVQRKGKKEKNPEAQSQGSDGGES